MRVMGLAGRGMAAMGLLGVGLTACQLVAGIEDIELTSGSSASASSGAGTGGTTGSSASSSATSSSASGAGGAPAPITVEYMASVTDCVNPASPNPDDCAQSAGAGKLRIDTDDNNTHQPWEAYLRFDLDNQLAGRTPTKITLYVTTTSDSSAPSPNSGEIWEVGMFDRNSLFSSAPAKMGASSLAGDLGSVAKSMTCSWTLVSSTLVGANKSVYLGLLPLSSDYALYYGKDGTTPPKLVIVAQ